MSDSIRDALTKAFEDAETADAADTTSEAPDSSSADAANAVPVEATDNAGADSASSPAATSPAPAAAPAPSSPPPASWSNAEKGSWASVPPAAQEAIKRREGEINRILQVSAEARRAVDEQNELFGAYDEVLKQLGATRTQAIQAALPTMAALYVGSEAQKVELITNAIFQHNVPVEALALSLHNRLQAMGGVQQQYQQHQAPAQPDIGKLVQDAMSNHPLMQQFQQRMDAQANEAVSSVAGLDHFDDVRLEMADILDRARNRGKSIDIYTAYNIACQSFGLQASPNPAAAADAQTRDAQGRFAASKRAASSVSGSPTPTPGYKPGSGSLRDEIINAMNNR